MYSAKVTIIKTRIFEMINTMTVFILQKQTKTKKQKVKVINMVKNITYIE